MGRYRKKPVEIEARQWDGGVPGSVTQLIEWITANGGEARYVGPGQRHHLRRADDPIASAFIVIETLEGPHRVDFLDFIIKGVKGEFYPCKPDIFEATYDEVTYDPKVDAMDGGKARMSEVEQIEAESYQPPRLYFHNGSRASAKIKVGDLVVPVNHMGQPRGRTKLKVTRIYKNGPRGQWRLEFEEIKGENWLYASQGALAVDFRKAA